MRRNRRDNSLRDNGEAPPETSKAKAFDSCQSSGPLFALQVTFSCADEIQGGIEILYHIDPFFDVIEAIMIVESNVNIY